MAKMTRGAPRVYLTVIGEDIEQVLSCLDSMKKCALGNISGDAYKGVECPVTTTFKFPLPSCMGIEIKDEGGI